MRPLFSFFFFLLLGNSWIQAEIVECQRVEEIFPYIQGDSCLFFEIDEVLASSKTSVGSIAFLEHLKQKLFQEGVAFEMILQDLYPLWVKIQKSNEMELKEPYIPLIFNSLKQRGIPVMALSHRGPSLAHDSFDQLSSLGISLHEMNPFQKSLLIEENKALYFEGMLLLHPSCNKGEYLLRFLDQVSYHPKRIICVDYEILNLVYIQQALEERGIAFTGIYMRPLNETRDIELAYLQLQFLNKILPDDVAEIISQK